jgi:hypothetical protein
MKKITLLYALLLCALGHSQTTLGLYTERATTSTASLNQQNTNVSTLNIAFSNAGTDAGASVIKAQADAIGNTQVYLNYPSPRLDISSYYEYHISLKSSSPDVTILRLEDEAGEVATVDNIAATYGMAYDGNWHSLTIPLSAFKTVNNKINFTKIKNIFLIKTTPGVAISNASTYLFYIDDVYLSSETSLSVKNFETTQISLYPNPATSEITIISKNKIDSVIVYNLNGQKVLESDSTEKLNISTLKSGVYIVSTIIDGASVTSKLIKE